MEFPTPEEVQAAIREAKEEIGLDLAPDSITFVGVLHRYEDEERIDFFVRVEGWSGEPVNTEPDKCDEVRWVKVNALPENTIPYVRQGIHNALTGTPFDVFGWQKN